MYYFKGNSNILGYKVDYKKSEEFRWSTALYTIEERCLVTHLIPNTKYRFRASCINSFGFSQFSWASEECETLTFGNSNITIQSELVEKLLSHHYDLIKTNQQWILIKKSNEEPKSIIIKKSEETKKSDQLGIQVIKPVVKPQPILQKIEESAERENVEEKDTELRGTASSIRNLVSTLETRRLPSIPGLFSIQTEPSDRSTATITSSASRFSSYSMSTEQTSSSSTKIHLTSNS